MSYLKDLTPGTVYIMEYSGSKWIVKNSGSYPYINGGGYNKGGTFTSDYKWEIASSEDTQWLLACIAANKYIPKEEIEFTQEYLIYN